MADRAVPELGSWKIAGVDHQVVAVLAASEVLVDVHPFVAVPFVAVPFADGLLEAGHLVDDLPSE